MTQRDLGYSILYSTTVFLFPLIKGTQRPGKIPFFESEGLFLEKSQRDKVDQF
jgi:hypothetical protein